MNRGLLVSVSVCFYMCLGISFFVLGFIFAHFLLYVASFVVSTSAVDCPDRLVSEMSDRCHLSLSLEITIFDVSVFVLTDLSASSWLITVSRELSYVSQKICALLTLRVQTN